MIVNVGCVQVAPDRWAVRVSGAYFVVFGPSCLIQWVLVGGTPIPRAATLLGRRRFTSFYHYALDSYVNRVGLFVSVYSCVKVQGFHPLILRAYSIQFSDSGTAGVYDKSQIFIANCHVIAFPRISGTFKLLPT